jgi:hypothetical protein
MGREADGPKDERWRNRLLAGADGVLHAASCCSPDAWLTDGRPDLEHRRTVDLTDPPEPEVAAEPPTGGMHVVGTTR